MKILVSFLAVAATLVHFNAIAADNPTPLNRDLEDKLVCGDVEVNSKSTCLVFPGFETHCKKQTLQLINSKKSISKNLPHDGKAIKHPTVKDGPVLDAMVTGWACVQAKSGASYLSLLYTCISSQRPDCTGTNKEWERLFSVEGKHMTAGLPKHGPKVEKLYRQLDLSEYINHPPEMRGVEY